MVIKLDKKTTLGWRVFLHIQCLFEIQTMMRNTCSEGISIIHSYFVSVLEIDTENLTVFNLEMSNFFDEQGRTRVFDEAYWSTP